MGFSFSKVRRDHQSPPLLEPQSHAPIPSVSLPPPQLPPASLPTPPPERIPCASTPTRLERIPYASTPPPPERIPYASTPAHPERIPYPSTRPPQSPTLQPPLPQTASSYPYGANLPYSSPPMAPRPSYYQYPPRSSYHPYGAAQSPPNPYSYPPPYNSQPPPYSQYMGYYNSGWGPGCPPPTAGTSAATPPPYVDHKTAKKIKNDVNVHKDTIKLYVDEQTPDSHLVSFTFDALVDGSITIYYFAKEEANCTFSPMYPEVYKPRRIPFQKGSGQKFRQPSGSGMDLGFFDADELSKPSQNEEIFPLVIYAETSTSSSMDEELTQPVTSVSSHAQITEAVLEKDNEGHFQVRVIKQILWIEGVRYELREIYGISNVDEQGFEDNDPGKECVICMTDPKDTAVLPCRHMCMCSECAKELRLQSNKCPICRQPIEELLEIKVNNASS